MDTGDWNAPAAAHAPRQQQAAPPARSAASSAARPAAAARPASYSSATHDSYDDEPAASRPAQQHSDAHSSHSRSSHHTAGAAHWLHTEPVTVAVDPATASDRPLYCLAVNERNGSFVVGGASHSLYVFDLASAALRRELYSKQSGHTEWVTCCATLADGRVLSGGMDSKLVLWASSGPRGVDLLGHTGSISKLAVDARDIGVSASYDRTIRVWSLNARQPRELHAMKATGPITALDWHNSAVLSGSREGQLALWDVNTGACVRNLSPSGTAQILTAQFGSIERGVAASASTQESQAKGVGQPQSGAEWLVAAGGADGSLRLYDLRAESCIFQKRLSAGNPGSVTDVAFGMGRLAVSLSDGVASLLDARAGFKTVAVLGGHRAPLQALRFAPNNSDVIVSAASNGWVAVHDVSEPTESKIDAAYAMGLTTAGGINAMHVGNDRVVVAGDDGQPVILQYGV